MAWIHINKYGEKKACDYICAQILKFDTTHGKGTKFNKTVTVASVKAVNHFIQKSKSALFIDFIQEFPRLKYNFLVSF